VKINRSKFVQHLERLSTAQQIKEVVFTDAFTATALTPDHLLLVVAPEVDGAEPLEDEIGVNDVDVLVRALKLAPGEGNEGVEVDVYLKEHRLIIDDEDRGMSELVVSSPKTITTRVESATVEKILKATEDADEVELTRTAIEGVRGAFGLYKAEQVQIQVDGDGVRFVVGDDNTNRFRVPLADEPAPKNGYTLLFGKHLIDVFSVIVDYSAAVLKLSGPNKPIVIEDGEYQYILSPRKAAAEAKSEAKAEKKAAKKSSKKEQVAETVEA